MQLDFIYCTEAVAALAWALHHGLARNTVTFSDFSLSASPVQLCRPIQNYGDGCGVAFGWRVHQDPLSIAGHSIGNLPSSWTKIVKGWPGGQSQMK